MDLGDAPKFRGLVDQEEEVLRAWKRVSREVEVRSVN